MRILFRLQGGYGLGDIVQHSIVLQHLRRYRPDWVIDVHAPRGPASALVGLCERVITTDKEEAEVVYDQVLNLRLHEHYLGAWDRPDTKVSYVLRSVFGIDAYDPDLGQTKCSCTQRDLHAARRYLRHVAPEKEDGRFGAVLLHYTGGSSKHKKDLQHWQVEEVVGLLKKAGRTPVVLDMQGECPFVDQKTVFSPRPGANDIWGSFGNAEAGIMAGLIRSSEAFLGIDSGPGKIASTTQTPTLIVWTRHHPLNYHDPAPNTTHLIPRGWKDTPRFEDERKTQFFLANYAHREYQGDHGLVSEALLWLAMTLGCDRNETAVKFVIPQDRQAVTWCLLKLRGLAQNRPIEVYVSGDPRFPLEALDIVRGFPRLIRKAEITPLPVHQGPERPQDTRGHYLYVAEGVRDGYHYLIPNNCFERGLGLDRWLPDVPIDREVDQALHAYPWYPPSDETLAGLK
jgi:ADP-heptose:LPS heptosyltransferase